MPTTTISTTMSMSMPAKLCQFQSHSSRPNWAPLPNPVQFRPRKTLEPTRFASSARRRISLPVLRAVATSEVSSPPPPTSTSEEAARTLYIGNIPRIVTSDELTTIVQEHGAVEKAEVMYDKYSKRSRRFGFAIMKTVEDANAAIEKLDGMEIGGRKIKVNITEKPLSGTDVSLLETEESQFVDSPHKVYVGNLSKTVTTDILKSFFSEKGNVLSAKVSRVPGTSKSSGFGFVTFSSEEDVELAISSLNNGVLEGQKIRVNKAS